MKRSVLIVEDDITFALMLKTWLQKQGFHVDTAENLRSAYQLLGKQQFQLILSDLRLPDGDGIDLLSWLHKEQLHSPLIIMTEYANIQSAVLAMKKGAVDYISKPIQPSELAKKIKETLAAVDESARHDEEPRKGRVDDTQAIHYLEGESEKAKQLYGYVSLVAPTQMSVLIQGASGTGKEYVAKRIHQQSKRADQPFVAIDCGAIPRDLAASEFFGHIKGAFTGAVQDKTGAFIEANKGTLFLDEVGNLTLEVQVQLLRAIQERRIRAVGSDREIEVDVRLITATNVNLEEAIKQGEFREDLFHRLNEFTLFVPLLKDREEDILLFANFFLDQANRELQREIVGFDEMALEAMRHFEWHGNLRQMRNIIKRATLLSTEKYIRLEELGPEFSSPAAPMETFPPALQQRNEENEKERILHALKVSGNNKSRAARLLEIDRKTLYNKLKFYDIH